jgi:hypothetical protein
MGRQYIGCVAFKGTGESVVALIMKRDSIDGDDIEFDETHVDDWIAKHPDRILGHYASSAPWTSWSPATPDTWERATAPTQGVTKGPYIPTDLAASAQAVSDAGMNPNKIFFCRRSPDGKWLAIIVGKKVHEGSSGGLIFGGSGRDVDGPFTLLVVPASGGEQVLKMNLADSGGSLEVGTDGWSDDSRFFVLAGCNTVGGAQDRVWIARPPRP